VPYTARIERPPFHRGGSVSKKGTLGHSFLHPSQAARCVSTEAQQAAAFLLDCLYLLFVLSRVAWLILDCARRTSTFLSCAFREQEDDQATLPLP